MSKRRCARGFVEFCEVGVLEPCCTRYLFSELKVVFQKMPFHCRNIMDTPHFSGDAVHGARNRNVT